VFEADVALAEPSQQSVEMLLTTDEAALDPDDAVAAAAGVELAIRLLQGRGLRFLAHAAGRRRHEGEVSSVGQELSAATGMRPTTATARTDLGCSAVTRLPRTLARLEAGALLLKHVEVVEQATRELSDEQARAVDAAVATSGARGLNRRLADAIARIAPEHARSQPEKADRERSAIYWNDAVEGQGGVSLQGPLAKVAQIKAAIDMEARLRVVGECRPIAARRFDVLYDWARGRLGLVDPSASGSEEGAASRPEGSCGQCGRSGPSRFPINVTVSLETLLRLSDVGGELDGEPIPAEVARELAADGRWRRWVLEPASGRLLDVGASTYRPGAELDRYVRARDKTCRFPSCTVPAVRCDLDHRKAFHTEGGETVGANLDTECRSHHRLKHVRGWSTAGQPDGGLDWQSPSGRHYVCPPEDHGGDDAVLSAYLARSSSRRRERERAREQKAAARRPAPPGPDPWLAPTSGAEPRDDTPF
jgi:hypothetical protein